MQRIIFLFLLFSWGIIEAKSTDSVLVKQITELSLLADSMNVAEAVEKVELNQLFLTKLRELLENYNSLITDFTSVTNLQILEGPQHKFRIYNWLIEIAPGTYQYFAFTQYEVSKKNRKVAVFELQDKNGEVLISDEQEYSAETWNGALYYQLIKAPKRSGKHFLLLGWNGNGDRTKTKVIEVISFDRKGMPTLGAPILKWYPEGRERAKYLSKHRLAFEYASKVNMTLLYDKDLKMVVFDHLAPTNDQLVGVRAAYVPDFSYDGLYFKKGKWYHKRNVDARNRQNTKVKKYKPSDVGQ